MRHSGQGRRRAQLLRSGESSADKARITAIVVAFDSAHALPDCLGALARERAPVIVVDNASSDSSAELAERLGVRVIRNARNEGYGRANNSGARAAESDFLLIVNPDIALEPGAVAALLAAAERYPDAGLLAPRIVEADGRFFFQPRSLLSPYLKNPGGRLALPEGDACAPYLSGACFMIRRALFLRLGGFDENIFLFYEDDDLCRRDRRRRACARPRPRRRGASRARPVERAEAGAAFQEPLASGLVAGLCGAQVRTAQPRARPLRAQRVPDGWRLPDVQPNHHRTLRRLGGGRLGRDDGPHGFGV